MSEELMTWRNEYGIGVDFIDNAHKELFLVIYRFESVVEERNREYRKSLCAAMLRYLIKYTAKHFREEEAYMTKIAYDGYAMHKQLHENLKNQTIPYLNKMLEEEKYSDEAISRFVAVLSSWLASHILIEDRAIIGGSVSRWINSAENTDISVKIDTEFKLFSTDLFGLKAELINRNYQGEYLGENMYSFYSTIVGQKKEYSTLLLCDEDFIRYVTKRIAGNICEDIDNGVLEAFEMIAHSWAKAAVSIVDRSNQVKLKDSSVLKQNNNSSFFTAPYPQQSLVWKMDKFQMAIAIR